MKILLVHNYLRPPSGENTVFEQERDLLKSEGDIVITYTRQNSEIEGMHSGAKSLVLISALWSLKTYNDLIHIIKKEKPDVAHFHNVFPLISPSAYRACQNQKVPVVQTLHNYRLVCPGGLLFRENKVCTDCAGMHFLPGIKHGCYRKSRIFTTGMAGIILFHKIIKTWQKSVDLYIALSEFAREKYKELGFPCSNFYVKPNFLQNPSNPINSDNGYGIYIGRIGEEKGIDYLLPAIRNCPNIKIKIVGDGPLREKLKKQIAEWNLQNVEYLGILEHYKCMQLLQKARFLVLPSQCYEGIPMVLLEAMSLGKPSIVSDIGVLPAMVRNGVSGLIFHSASVEGLTAKMKWIHEHSEEAREMGKKARQIFEQNYLAEDNYKMLMQAYDEAIEVNRGGHARR